MNLIVIAALCFAVAAMLGLALARMHFALRAPPMGLVLLHGLAAASGLSTLLAGYLRAANPPSLLTASLVTFALAALGGFVLLSLHALRGRPPRFAIVGHALVAVTAFTMLLLHLLGAGM